MQTINQEEIKSYLKDIRKIKVMTPERERELSKIITNPDVSERDKELVYQEILEGNLRFVISIAKKYQNQGMELSDLIAEGNYGLLRAVKTFDWSKNYRFISYAVWWVRQSILQSLNDHSRTIRIPVNLIQELFREKKDIKNTDKVISEKFSGLPKTVDLDGFINENGDTLFDTIINENSPMPDDAFNTEEILKQKLIDVLNILDDRERIIVEDYYGISGAPKTLEEIGNDFKLTKERVRQIKERALRKLRNESSSLFEYF
jgi:RNA polymerase primary sigma factor